MQKVSRKGGIGDTSGQTLRGSDAVLGGFSRRRFCDAAWGRGESFFLSKKIAKWYRRLKYC
jgi:hypothetical protein